MLPVCRIATADSYEPGINPPQAVLDSSSLMTFWHSKWSNNADPLPHAITLFLAGSTYSVNGLRYQPRQDGNPNGRCGAWQVLLPLCALPGSANSISCVVLNIKKLPLCRSLY